MKPLPLPKQKNLRADCAWVVYQILEHGKSARDCLEKVQRRHTPRDNAWLQEMSLGVMRKLPVLQHWLRILLDRPLKGNKKVIEHLILLGFYQLAFSRVSTHAAVGETVNAAPYLGGGALKGLVNALLRNFQREDLANKPVENPIVASGFPKWLYKAIENAYPNSGDDVREASNGMGPLWLRVNQQQVDFSSFCDALDTRDIPYSTSEQHTHSVVLQTREDITSLPGFDEGWFAVQDGAAQLAAPYLGAKKGERILDCCCAPGGKTGHILELTPDVETCIALDFDDKRLQRVTENMTRLKHAPVVIQGDASKPADWWDGQQFDRILLDAPCSATGVIRRHPDIRWLRKSSDIDALIQLQARILEALWPTLKPGGTLLYATCSILPGENVEQMRTFIANHEDAMLSPLHKNDSNATPGRQILPSEAQMDGFYYARLVKSES